MKKHFIIIALLYATSAHAQIEKGSVLLGTDILITSTKTDASSFYSTSSSSSEVRFAPYAGYFASVGFAIGVQLDVSHSENGSTNSYVNSYSQPGTMDLFGIGPLFRYYTFFGDKFCLQNALSLYALSGKAQFGSSYPYYSSSSEKLKGGIGAYNLKAGYLIRESVGLQVSLIDLSYAAFTTTAATGGSEGVTTYVFNFSSLMSAPQIGIEFYIRPKTQKK
jgi:hypothetical protein